MSIMTFGSAEAEQQECHTVWIGIQLKDGGHYEISTLTVPLIFDSLAAMPVQFCMRNYRHLQELHLADMVEEIGSAMTPQVLIGLLAVCHGPNNQRREWSSRVTIKRD